MLHAHLPPARRLLLPALVALSLNGCATREFVQQQVDAVNQRIASLEGQVGLAGQRIDANAGRLQVAEARLGQAEQGASRINQRLDETQADLAGAQRNLAGLLIGLNAASGRIDANSAEIAGTQKRVFEVEQQVGTIGKRLDITQGDLAGVQQNVAGLLMGLNSTSQRLDEALAGLAKGEARSVAAQPVMPVPTVPAAPAEAMPAPGAGDIQERLNRVGALIDEVHRRINVNTSSLQGANQRIGVLEAGLAAADRRGEDAQVALKATQDEINAAQTQLAAAEKRIDANTHALEVMGPQIDTIKAELKTAAARLDASDARLAEMGVQLSRTAQEALERAIAAGKLAEGRFVTETVLSEAIGFGLDKAGLSESARLALVAFADQLKARNQAVFIEIQGHTDNTGTPEANLRLARQRAEAVRDFLHQEAGLPLHRLAVAAYGASRPVADNATREGRIQNRRVVLVVLK